MYLCTMQEEVAEAEPKEEVKPAAKGKGKAAAAKKDGVCLLLPAFACSMLPLA